VEKFEMVDVVLAVPGWTYNFLKLHGGDNGKFRLSIYAWPDREIVGLKPSARVSVMRCPCILHCFFNLARDHQDVMEILRFVAEMK
jgi:hypothetical protein